MADEKTPHVGVIVKMSNTGPKLNCSLSVSVICDSNGVQVLVPLAFWSQWILFCWSCYMTCSCYFSSFCLTGTTFAWEIRNLRLCECFDLQIVILLAPYLLLCAVWKCWPPVFVGSIYFLQYYFFTFEFWGSYYGQNELISMLHKEFWMVVVHALAVTIFCNK